VGDTEGRQAHSSWKGEREREWWGYNVHSSQEMKKKNVPTSSQLRKDEKKDSMRDFGCCMKKSNSQRGHFMKIIVHVAKIKTAEQLLD